MTLKIFNLFNVLFEEYEARHSCMATQLSYKAYYAANGTEGKQQKRGGDGSANSKIFSKDLFDSLRRCLAKGFPIASGRTKQGSYGSESNQGFLYPVWQEFEFKKPLHLLFKPMLGNGQPTLLCWQFPHNSQKGNNVIAEQLNSHIG